MKFCIWNRVSVSFFWEQSRTLQLWSDARIKHLELRLLYNRSILPSQSSKETIELRQWEGSSTSVAWISPNEFSAYSRCTIQINESIYTNNYFPSFSTTPRLWAMMGDQRRGSNAWSQSSLSSSASSIAAARDLWRLRQTMHCLEQCNFYHGNLNRNEARERMRRCRPG